MNLDDLVRAALRPVQVLTPFLPWNPRPLASGEELAPGRAVLVLVLAANGADAVGIAGAPGAFSESCEAIGSPTTRVLADSGWTYVAQFWTIKRTINASILRGTLQDVALPVWNAGRGAFYGLFDAGLAVEVQAQAQNLVRNVMDTMAAPLAAVASAARGGRNTVEALEAGTEAARNLLVEVRDISRPTGQGGGGGLLVWVVVGFLAFLLLTERRK